jgi:hypothetical protein
MTAAENHLVCVVNWLLKDARRWPRQRVRESAAEHRLFDVVLGMTRTPADDLKEFLGSVAAPYEDQLMRWLPDVSEVTLLARRGGRDAASVNAFIDAAVCPCRTLTFIETENGAAPSAPNNFALNSGLCTGIELPSSRGELSGHEPNAADSGTRVQTRQHASESTTRITYSS